MQGNKAVEFVEVDILKLINGLEQFITESTNTVTQIHRSADWDNADILNTLQKMLDDVKRKHVGLKELSLNLVATPYAEGDTRVKIDISLRNAEQFMQRLDASLKERQISLNEIDEAQLEQYKEEASLSLQAKNTLQNACEIFKYPSLAAKVNIEDFIPIIFKYRNEGVDKSASMALQNWMCCELIRRLENHAVHPEEKMVSLITWHLAADHANTRVLKQLINKQLEEKAQAFKQKYTALRNQNILLAMRSDFLQNKEHYSARELINTILAYIINNPGSRTAEAWKQVQTEYGCEPSIVTTEALAEPNSYFNFKITSVVKHLLLGNGPSVPTLTAENSSTLESPPKFSP